MISKRLRYEILRRDGHHCRYCGLGSDEVTLTVDHVIPTTLGGTDDPSNLVAACRDCNSGKASSSPDAPIVEDVARDALRWARAMQIAAANAAIDRNRMRLSIAMFDDGWTDFHNTSTGDEIWRPDNWDQSVRTWLSLGLTIDDLTDLVDQVMAKRLAGGSARWKYLCGMAWRLLERRQEQARALIATAETTDDPDEALA
jgi:hypothetical protein